MDRWSILYLNVNKKGKKGKKKKRVIIENTQIVFTRKPKLSLNTSFWLCLCQLRKTSQTKTSSI